MEQNTIDPTPTPTEHDKMSRSTAKICLLVLGMHRSGTSALTRVLSLLGATLPKQIIGATTDNELGHWEPNQIVTYNNNLLDEFGSTWDDWRKLDLHQLSAERQKQIYTEIGNILQDEYGDADVIVVKDPRMCRCFPLYSTSLQHAGYDVRPILPIRNPVEVWESLQRREEFWPLDKTPADAALLWLRHVLDAEVTTRGYPRTFITYEGLLTDWKINLTKIASDLNMQWQHELGEITEEVEQFLSPDHRHFHRTIDDLQLEPVLDTWIRATYHSLLTLTQDAQSTEALQKLDHIRNIFDEFTPLLYLMQADQRLAVEQQVNQLTHDIEQATRQLHERKQDIVDLTEQIKHRDEQIKHRDEQIEHRDEQIANTNITLQNTQNHLLVRDQELQETRIRFNDVRVAMRQLGLKRVDIETDKQIAQDKLDSIHNSRTWRIATRIDSLAQRIEQLRTGTTTPQTSPINDTIQQQIEIARERFDESYYLEQYPDVAQSKYEPIEHYFRFGWREGRNPSAEFVTNYYLEAYPDVILSGKNPFIHYLQNGEAEGRQALPNTKEASSSAFDVVAYTVVSLHFDTKFYLSEYPDIRESNLDPVEHYLVAGWHENRNPHPDFSTELYVQNNPEILESQINPFYHAIIHGKIGKNKPTYASSETAQQNYIDQVLTTAQKKPKIDLEYIPKIDQPFDVSNSPLKLIAFYLPQFHPIPENDQWWGKGFTEWTNVSKAIPQFVGHYQPHLPGELGFYDLRLEDVQQQQIELAKHYGIYGFCYHHYWFGGQRLLERPVNQILANPALDLPFCLCWANENWTRRWDGLERDILMEQHYSPEADLAFIDDIAPALRDRRYIRFQDRPVLLVYRINDLPDPKATAERWREYCIQEGIGELYLVAARSFGTQSPDEYGFDSVVEFPPHEANASILNNQMDIINPHYQGKIYDYQEMAQSYLEIDAEDFINIKTVSPGWDNEPRKPGQGHMFYGASPISYARWLQGACEYTIDKMAQDDTRPPFVFINAWNEWAEGAHLEPDQRFGYGNLHVSASVLQLFTPLQPELETAIATSQQNFKKSGNTAVVLHLFYGDLYHELSPYLQNATKMDLFVSIGADISPAIVARLQEDFPNVYLVNYPNRGRDVLPFMNLLQVLQSFGYEYACKIHTKKSPQRTDGTRLRRDTLNTLLGSPETVQDILSTLESNETIGIIAAPGTSISLAETDRHILNLSWLDRLLSTLERPDLIGNYDWEFIAGTMFWFRISALSKLGQLGLSDTDFEVEAGQVDGTLAHAIERIIALCCTEAGYVTTTLN